MNFLIKYFHKFANTLLRSAQKLLNTATIGVQGIILNDNNQVLLVQHTYQKGWYIPGGGVKAGEAVVDALLRELKEEIGLTVYSEPEFFGIYHNNYKGINDYPIVYVVRNFKLELAKSNEIESMKWFSLEQLPEDISPGTRRRINEYLSHKARSKYW